MRIATLSGISGYGNLRVSIAPDTAADVFGNSAPGTGPSQTILVGGPIANFGASPTIAAAPHKVRFTDRSDPSALPIDAWHWTFGDGATSDESNPTHTYEELGAYDVSLTVTSAIGSDTKTRCGYIRIVAAMPAYGLLTLVLLTFIVSICGIIVLKNFSFCSMYKKRSCSAQLQGW